MISKLVSKKWVLYSLVIFLLLFLNSILLAGSSISLSYTPSNWESHKREIISFSFIVFILVMSIISLIILHKKQVKAEYEAQQLRNERVHIARLLSMGEIAASLAHELNQPLSAIRTYAQTAQRFLSMKEPDVDEVKKALTGIISGNRRAEEVIKRVRMSLKNETLEYNYITISEIINDILILTNHKAKQENISIKMKFHDDSAIIYGDKIQLQQVLCNLVINAMEAMQDDTIKYYKNDEIEYQIIISSHTKEVGFITISVKDNGVGINLGKNQADSLFDAFYTTKSEGMGMGLSISRSIIEEHGGKFWASSNSGKGSTFSFSLPIDGKFKHNE